MKSANEFVLVILSGIEDQLKKELDMFGIAKFKARSTAKARIKELEVALDSANRKAAANKTFVEVQKKHIERMKEREVKSDQYLIRLSNPGIPTKALRAEAMAHAKSIR